MPVARKLWLLIGVMMPAAAERRPLRQRVRELLAAVRIPSPEKRFRDFPHQMSGGMRQRIVGAIAQAGGPKLIIADEPTTNLDVTIQLQYLNLLKDLQRASGVALIFVTHNLGIVAKMCDRVAVMYAGRIAGSHRISRTNSSLRSFMPHSGHWSLWGAAEADVPMTHLPRCLLRLPPAVLNFARIL
jgi:ABC-type dipeptide/oligopeptide/nickel transport system ATPase component